MDTELLRQVRSQTAERLSTGEEPPWVWFRLMKLQEALDQVLGELDSPIMQTANLLQSDQRPGRHLQLVGPTYQPDSAQRHRDTDS